MQKQTIVRTLLSILAQTLLIGASFGVALSFLLDLPPRASIQGGIAAFTVALALFLSADFFSKQSVLFPRRQRHFVDFFVDLMWVSWPGLTLTACNEIAATFSIRELNFKRTFGRGGLFRFLRALPGVGSAQITTDRRSQKGRALNRTIHITFSSDSNGARMSSRLREQLAGQPNLAPHNLA